MQMLFIRLLISLKMLLAARPVLIKVLPMTEHLPQPRVAARLISELQFHRHNTLNLLHGVRHCNVLFFFLHVLLTASSPLGRGDTRMGEGGVHPWMGRICGFGALLKKATRRPSLPAPGLEPRTQPSLPTGSENKKSELTWSRSSRSN